MKSRELDHQTVQKVKGRKSYLKKHEDESFRDLMLF